MIDSFDYDLSYVPAMPVAPILLGRAHSEPSFPLTAVVDSGADASVIPKMVLQQLRARRNQKVWMRGATNLRILVDLYTVSLRLGVLEQRSLLVVGGDADDEAIIGRDVLNQLVVTLNGLAGVLEIVR